MIENLDFPTHILIVGETKSGKSTLLKYLVQKNIEKADYIIIFSQTKCSGEYDYIKKSGKNGRVYENLNNIVIEKIIDNQKSYTIKSKKPPALFLIMDDILGNNFYDKNKLLYTKLFGISRHYNISCWILLQSFNGLIPPAMRENCLNIFTCDVNNNLINTIFANSIHTNKKEYHEFCIKNCKKQDTALWIKGEKNENLLPIPIKYYN